MTNTTERMEERKMSSARVSPKWGPVWLIRTTAVALIRAEAESRAELDLLDARNSDNRNFAYWNVYQKWSCRWWDVKREIARRELGQ